MAKQTTNDDRARGQCLCGAVQFEVSLPSLWCAHCHCRLCRLAHGAPFVTWFGVAADRFRYLAGEGEVSTYKSSAPARRSYCGRCGTTFLFESTRWPGEVHIALACMTDPIDRAPERNVYIESKVDWIELPTIAPSPSGEA